MMKRMHHLDTESYFLSVLRASVVPLFPFFVPIKPRSYFMRFLRLNDEDRPTRLRINEERN